MDDIRWFDPREAPFQLLGFPWFNEYRAYRRLPPKTGERPIPDAVDVLADHTAGGQIRFVTDSKHVYIRTKLQSLADMCHMPATGQCGFDCYIYVNGRPRFTGCAKYDIKQTEYECLLFAQDAAVRREAIINFPLYKGVESVEVGLDDGAAAEAPNTILTDKRCVIYGTSIAQGGCATRPGLVYSNILSRRINAECINLGFSGAGRGEPIMADLMASIKRPGCYILDYEANVDYDTMASTLPVFLRILREENANTPILVVSKTMYAVHGYSESAISHQTKIRRLQRGAVEERRSAGDGHIYFLDGSSFFGDDFDECTVDGSHPNDIGFMRMADALAPVVKVLMGL